MRFEPRPVLVVLSAFAVVDVLLGDLLIRIGDTTGNRFVSKVGEYFWADQEANIWSWYSSFLLGAIGLGFLVLALRAIGHRRRRALLVLGCAAVLMSADETASLHEALGYLGDSVGGITSHWLLLGIPLAVAAGLFALRLARVLPASLRHRLIVAGIVYLLGAVALEFLGGMLSGPMGLPRSDLRYIAEVTVEELMEFLGTLLAVRAVLLALQEAPSPVGLSERPLVEQA